MSTLNSFVKWLRLKHYQFEITFGVYVFTPAERFVFCEIHCPSAFQDFNLTSRVLTLGSCGFLITALALMASFLYLPRHIQFFLTRAWFYLSGDKVDMLR